MISEYVNLQMAISNRAVEVGRILQQEHYAMTSVPFPAAVPGLNDISENDVAIVVGMSADKEWVCIHIPIHLFETGTPADIRVWSYAQNTANERRLKNMEDADATGKRTGEIAMLKELAAKYPEALNE